jgi:hypothetical protein
VKYFLGKDPISGISRYMEYDSLTDTTTEYAEQDIAQEVEASKQLQNNDEFWKQGVKDEFAMYAHIPAILLEKWAMEGVDINDAKALIKKVNNPDYAYLRTTTKRHA